MKKRNVMAKYRSPYGTAPPNKDGRPAAKATSTLSMFKDIYERMCTAMGVDTLPNAGTNYATDHVGCPAGEDRKKRLFFVREYANGAHVIKGYCHNCQEGVVWKDSNIGGRSLFTVDLDHAYDEDRADNGYGLPGDAVPILLENAGTTVPIGASQYLRSYGIEGGNQWISPMWSDTLGRIVFPVYDYFKDDDDDDDADSDTRSVVELVEEHRYMGYVARVLPEPHSWVTTYTHPTPSRYITASGSEGLKTVLGDPGAARRIVFVEDMISAARVATDCRELAVPLFGCTIDPERILRVVTRHRTMTPVIWLDNDRGAIKARERLTALLHAFGRAPTVIQDLTEPKRISTHTLCRTLFRCPGGE